ncbi:hypothetical protein AAFF_G00244830 [Aldrovandia affinis]|uniref:Fibronectin type-III domain-containing protein n=1 Tax=Aldrovandia affinis TaxID=143900 RepID=A0AAD7RE21_9TELE|nr:hypothetical protein AAFF_G00244830 [Aldrovandia affinis]
MPPCCSPRLLPALLMSGLGTLLFLASGVQSQGKLKLTVLSEDRLQMKWKEAESPVQGYKVRVRPISDEPQPELMLTTTRGRATVAGLDSQQEYALQILMLNGTQEKLIAKRRFTIDSLREEWLNRSGSREQRKKVLAGGSGSGDIDELTEALLAAPTVLFQDRTETTVSPDKEKGSKEEKKKRKNKDRTKAGTKEDERTMRVGNRRMKTPAGTNRRKPSPPSRSQLHLKRLSVTRAPPRMWSYWWTGPGASAAPTSNGSETSWRAWSRPSPSAATECR